MFVEIRTTSYIIYHGKEIAGPFETEKEAINYANEMGYTIV